MADSPSLSRQGLSKESEARQETQKKTFTKWLNAHLRKVNAEVEDLFVDLRDGVRLIQLLEVLRDKRLPREKGKMRLHRVANLNAVLKFLASDGVRLVNIDAGDLCDGNVKLTLGLIWTLILKYQISGAGGDGQAESKAKLLDWCRRCTDPYSNVDVTNFTTSWRNGLAFNAIIHHHRSDLVDYESLSPDNAHTNLQQAFDVAERELNVAALLDPEDVTVATPDEKSILTYVALLKDALPEEPQQRVDAPATKTEADGAGPILQEKETVTKSANDLLEWTNAKKKDLSRPYDFPLGNADALRALLKDHEAFLAGDEFASKKGEKERLTLELPALAKRLRATDGWKQADLKPSADEINSAWDGGLLPEETTYREALEKSIAEAEERSRAFQEKTAKLRRWADKNANTFSDRTSFPDDLAALYGLNKRLDEHEGSDFPQKDQQKNEIEEELSKFAENGGMDSAAQKSVNGLLDSWKSMSAERALYKDALSAAIAQGREKMRQRKVDQVETLIKWLDESAQKFKGCNFPNDVSELETLLAEVNLFNDTEQPPKKSESDTLQTEIEKMASDSNQIIGKDEAQSDCQRLDDAWAGMEKEKAAYREALENALQKQKKATEMKKAADDLIKWVVEKQKKFATRSFPADLESLQALRIGYDDDYLSNEFPPRHSQKNNLVQQMEDEDQLSDEKEKLQSTWKSLQQVQADYRKALEGNIAACQVRQQTYADSNDLLRWARLKHSDFSQCNFSSSSLDELKGLLSALDTFDSGDFPEKKGHKAALDVRLQEAGETDLDFEDTWDSMLSAHEAYRAALEAALKDKEEEEKRRKKLDELSQWIAMKTAEFACRDFPPDLDELLRLASEFDGAYLLEERPPKEDERTQLTQSLVENKSSEKAATLRELWQSLDEEQREYRRTLDAAIRNTETHLARSADLQEWVNSKRQAFKQREFPTDFQALEALCDAYDIEYAAKELPDKTEEVNKFVSEHVELATTATLQDSFQTLQGEQSDYRKALGEALKQKKEEAAARNREDEKRRRWQQMDQLEQWISAKQSLFTHLDFPKDVQKLQKLAADFDGAYLTGERPPKQDEKDQLANDFAEHGEQVGADKLNSLWTTMQGQQDKYRQDLEAALRALAQQEEDCKRRLDALNGWVSTKRQAFSRHDFPSDVDHLRQLANEFDRSYLGSELPPKQTEKNQLVEEIAGNQNDNVSHLQDNWINLEKEQDEYRQALAAALQLAEKAAVARQRLGSLSEWIATRRAAFAKRDFPPSRPELEQLTSDYDNGYLHQELPPKANEKVHLCQTLEEEGSLDDAVSLKESWQSLEMEQAGYRRALDEAMQAVEAQLAQADKLQKWVDSKRQTFSQRHFPDNIQALESLRDQYDNDYVSKELPSKSSELSIYLSTFAHCPSAPDLSSSFQALQQEQVDYRHALEIAISKKLDDEKHAKLVQWVEERTAAFTERDFSEFSERDFEKAENTYANYKVDELPNKEKERAILVREASGGSPLGDKVLVAAWERLEREEALYREALDAARKESTAPVGEEVDASEVQTAGLQGQPHAQPTESNDKLPLLDNNKQPSCDCCCCRCRRSVWKCCCSTCCPQCHCRCSPCCAPPCCTIL